MFTLLRGGEVYGPARLGENDILIWEGRIVAIGPNLKVPREFGEGETIDVSGSYVTPGFIDYHNHFLGGGGNSGYSSRVPELPLTCLTTAGITTVVGCLGMDNTTRSMADLYGKACALEAGGVTTYIYTGATFEHPIPTLTGRVRTDIIYVDKVIGVGEVSLSELGPSFDSYGSGAQYVAKIACEAHLAGRIAGKAGIVVLQVPGSWRGLEPLFEILEKTHLPVRTFVPAHVNQNKRYLQQAKKFGEMGGYTDITSSYAPQRGFPNAVKPSQAARELRESGVPLERITMTTDGNGAHPRGSDADGWPTGSEYLAVSSLFTEFQDMVRAEGFALEDALRVFTANPARITRLFERKGHLKPGADADILVLSKDLALDKVFCKGRLMVEGGRAVVRGPWEEAVYGPK